MNLKKKFSNVSSIEVITFISFLFLSNFCLGQKGLIPYEGLKGKPHHVQIIDHVPIPENSKDEPQVSSWEIYEFDDKGRKVGYQIYRKDASRVSGGTRYFYLKNGLVDYQENYELNGELRSRADHTYDQKGRLIKTQIISGGKETALKEITYDPKKPISYTKLIYNGKDIVQNSVDQLDEEGRILLMTDFLPNGNLKGKLEYAYDQRGNEVLQKWYNAADQLFVFYKKYYNDRNEEIRNEKYDIVQGDTVLTSTTTTEYRYDEKGNQSEVIIRTGGVMYIKKVVPYYPED